MSFLIDIPLKKAEEVNWVKPLNNYLLSIYGNTQEYQLDLQALNKLRQDLRGVSGGDPNSIAMYCKYYSQIELLDLRIPFSTVNKHKKIEFVWHDVFQRGVVHNQHALPFEKANVLFNLGAALSKRAVIRHHESKKEESGDDAIKELIQLFQQLAGIYQFLSENFLHAPSYDLSQATVTFLKKLMLAQSMEVFVGKVISGDLEQKKNSLIAKLCSATAAHYEGCFLMISHLTGADLDETEDDDDFEEEEGIEPITAPAESTTHVKAHLHVSWIATIHLKSVYFHSLALYFNGLQLESTRKYGDALAYLTKSSNLLAEIVPSTLKSIASSLSNDAYEILDAFKYQQDAVQIKLTDLNKDNDLIYHEIIPLLVTLPEVKPMDSTKVVPINDNPMFKQVNEHNYTHFLNNVVPINIHEMMSFYSEEKLQFLRNELDLVDVLNEEIASELEYLGLPKKLVELKETLRGEEVDTGDAELSTKADAIAAKRSTDDANRTKIAKLRQQIYDTVTTTEQHPGSRDDTLRVKKSLYDASQSDLKLFELVGSEQQLYDTLSSGLSSAAFKRLFESLESKAPEVSLLDLDETLSSPTFDNQIVQVEDLLNDLSVLRKNKDKLIATLKKEIHDDDISDILILNSKIKLPSEIKSVIFPAELKKFEPYNVELDKLITEQKSLVKELKEKWGALQSNSELTKKLLDRKKKQEAVKSMGLRIDELYARWQKYSTGLAKGVDFYSQLLNYAQALKKKTEEAAGDARLDEEFARLRVQQAQPPVPPRLQSQGLGVSGQYTGEAPRYGQAHTGQFSTQSSAQHTGQYSTQPGQYSSQPSVQHTGQYSAQPPIQGSRYDRPAQIPGAYESTSFPQPMLYNSGPSTPSSQGQSAPSLPPKRPSQSGDNNGLIYNQPSTYDPNMYSFFGKQ